MAIKSKRGENLRAKVCIENILNGLLSVQHCYTVFGPMFSFFSISYSLSS